MAIFHSYVKLPEDIWGCFLKWSKPKSSTSDFGKPMPSLLCNPMEFSPSGVLQPTNTQWNKLFQLWVGSHFLKQQNHTLVCALLVYVPLFIYLLVNLVIHKQIDLSTGPHGPTLYRMFLAHNANRVCGQLYEQPRKCGKHSR